MQRPPLVHRLVAHTLAAAVLIGSLAFPAAGMAADPTVFELRPHCSEQDLENVFGGPSPDIPWMTKPTTGRCYDYAIKDPQTRQTNFMEAGEELDMDLVIKNAGSKPVHRVRAWLAYDPTILEGISIELEPAFDQPTPGEQVFMPTDGYAKIGASASNPPSGNEVIVARVRMKVKETTAPQTIISFFNATGDVGAESAIVTREGTEEESILEPPVGSLLVRLGVEIPTAQSASSAPMAEASSASILPPAASSQPASSAIASSAASSASSASSIQSSSAASVVPILFGLLQVQNLRVTTEGTTAYLAWDPLVSAEIAGYNAYYGTVSGEYIQRRSVDKSSTTLAIHNLIPGTRYYFAVRGFNAANAETEFSQEVAVVIGQPSTSTSPLSASGLPGPNGLPPKTDGSIAGSTGPSSVWMLLLLASAGIGTIAALRRQSIASLAR